MSMKLGPCTHKMLEGKVTYKNYYQISRQFRSPENLPDYFFHSAPNVLTISNHSIHTVFLIILIKEPLEADWIKNC